MDSVGSIGNKRKLKSDLWKIWKIFSGGNKNTVKRFYKSKENVYMVNH